MLKYCKYINKCPLCNLTACELLFSLTSDTENVMIVHHSTAWEHLDSAFTMVEVELKILVEILSVVFLSLELMKISVFYC